MALLDEVRREFSKIDNAATELVSKLSRQGIYQDLALSAEIAGLMLLRHHAVGSVPTVPPGTHVVGLVNPSAMESLERFMFAFAIEMGLTQKHLTLAIDHLPAALEYAKVPLEMLAYRPEIATKYEGPFRVICASNGIGPAHSPFVPALSAVKFIGGGDKIGELDKRIGFAFAVFHMGMGSKTIPFKDSDPPS